MLLNEELDHPASFEPLFMLSLEPNFSSSIAVATHHHGTLGPQVFHMMSHPQRMLFNRHHDRANWVLRGRRIALVWV